MHLHIAMHALTECVFVLIGPHVSQDHREKKAGPHEQLPSRPVSAHSCRLHEERPGPHRED